MNENVKEMSKNPQDQPREVRVEMKKHRRHTSGPLELKIDHKSYPKVSSVSSDYAYVNPAYMGSSNSVHNPQTRIEMELPVDRVYREQYCVCSRWPFAKKILAVAVGLLVGVAVGAGIGLSISSIRGEEGLDFPLLRGTAASY